MHAAPVRSESFSEAQFPTLDVDSGPTQPLSDSADRTCRYLTDEAPMSDGERELRIGKHGSLMLHFMAEWDAHGNFDDRGHAERHLMLMSDLIRERSPEQVARMERERGLA